MIKKKPKPHQLEAVAKALPYPGFAFFLEQRTGKTLTALMMVDKRKPSLVLIVTTKKGIRVWNEEIRDSLKVDWKCRLEVIHYEGLHKYRAKYRKLFREWTSGEKMVICDESHRIKRRGSQPARVVRSLGKLAEYRLALTGTPLAPRSRTKRRKRSAPVLSVTKGLEDAWSQFDFIDPSIFGTADDFEKKYLIKGGFRGFQVVGYRNQKTFYKKFHRYSYRKLLREVQEKPTLIRRRRIFFELGRKAREAYDTMDRDMYVKVNGGRMKIPTLLTKLGKLQQLAGGFVIDTETKEVHKLSTDKLLQLGNLLNDILKGHGEKAVICAKFSHEIESIARLCRKLGFTVQVIEGGSDFSGAFDVDVTVIQIQSAIAIDLAAAKSFIFYSMGHNPTDFEQARFRVLSLTKRRVDFYYLLARRTIDELVYEAQTRKKSLATLVLDYYRRQYEQLDHARSSGSVRGRPRLLGRR